MKCVRQNMTIKTTKNTFPIAKRITNHVHRPTIYWISFYNMLPLVHHLHEYFPHLYNYGRYLSNKLIKEGGQLRCLARLCLSVTQIHKNHLPTYEWWKKILNFVKGWFGVTSHKPTWEQFLKLRGETYHSNSYKWRKNELQ